MMDARLRGAREVPEAAPGNPAGGDPFTCQWEDDLARAGIDHQPSAAIRIGAPLLALAMLAAAVGLALVAPDEGRAAAPLALSFAGVAAVPWLDWLIRGDRGPTWTALGFMLGPLLALGIGHWFVDALGLGSGAAYPLLAFPGLLVVVLGIAAADVSMTIGIVVSAWIAYGGPLIAAWVAGRDVDPGYVATWHVGFALAVVAGYAVRLSYSANLLVSEAREALARREAAEARRQVARDVHDVVAHTLAVTMLHMTAARMAVKRDAPAEAVAALEEAERHGRSSLADIRRMVRLLRDDDVSALDAAQPGLVDIGALVDGYRTAGLLVDMRIDLADQEPSPVAQLAIYRVLQEALTNAARHGAGPATVRIEAGAGAAGLSLRVDNPVMGAESAPTRGSGLIGMRERIAAAGGSIEAGARQGRWIVEAVIPAEASA